MPEEIGLGNYPRWRWWEWEECDWWILATSTLLLPPSTDEAGGSLDVPSCQLPLKAKCVLQLFHELFPPITEEEGRQWTSIVYGEIGGLIHHQRLGYANCISAEGDVAQKRCFLYLETRPSCFAFSVIQDTATNGTHGLSLSQWFYRCYLMFCLVILSDSGASGDVSCTTLIPYDCFHIGQK